MNRVKLSEEQQQVARNLIMEIEAYKAKSKTYANLATKRQEQLDNILLDLADIDEDAFYLEIPHPMHADKKIFFENQIVTRVTVSPNAPQNLKALGFADLVRVEEVVSKEDIELAIQQGRLTVDDIDEYDIVQSKNHRRKNIIVASDIEMKERSNKFSK